MAESPVATSTPSNESTYRRREERAQRFLSGTTRAAYRLDPLLERSLSTSISDVSQGSELGSEEDIKETLRVMKPVKRRVECKRGCPAVLKRMSKAYESFGKHTGKTAQYRSSYPDPKNPERSPRNVTGKCTTSVVKVSLSASSLSPSLSLAQNQWIRYLMVTVTTCTATSVSWPTLM